jgi:N,N'-diacetylchitobiose phosphorylase
MESLKSSAAPPRTRVPARVLSNGSYAVLLTARGGGMAAHRGYALTRWDVDPVRDMDGTFIYVRDLDSGEWWCPTPRPAPYGAELRSAVFDGGVAHWECARSGIELRLEVAVAADRDVEVRRLAIRNASGEPRRIEITTCAAVVLNTPAADAAHPAFSRLFVQTAFDEERRALFAWRRLRSPGDRPLWFGHRLLAGADAEVEYETDRARFIGRGRSAGNPEALRTRERLSGTTGSVLDPVFALRTTLHVEPQAERSVHAVYCAAGDPISLQRALDSVASAADADEVIASPARDANALDVLGLPERWLRNVAFDEAWSGGAAFPGSGRAQVASPAAAGAVASARNADGQDADGLEMFNGYGGFTPDGDEYVIRVDCDADSVRLPPMPWVNVIANEHAGCIVSERGSIHTWAANSRENRLTPWFNDPVSDPHGEAFWVRDDETGAYHSLTPGPTPAPTRYEVRHGFGYTRFRHEHGGLTCDATVFVPRYEPVRIVRVSIRNDSDRPRAVSVFSYAQLVLGGEAAATRGEVSVAYDEATGALLARNNERGEFSARVAFAAAVADGATKSWCADRASFFGDAGDIAAPAALTGDSLESRTGEDPCAAWQVSVRIDPGETSTCAFLLGEGDEAGAARTVLHRFTDAAAVDESLDNVRAFWRDLLASVQVETPSPMLDRMVNGWLSYQNLACRVWGRTAFYQSGGAFGFRDQLQDASALLYLDPAYTRRQILLHAAHQFVEGDVLHWWHPPLSKGIRTRFSDDLLWLPYITAFYVESTGDDTVLDQVVGFVQARPLEEGEDEVFLVPERSHQAATVFEHCCRSIDRSLTTGAHGLPLMGTGDWNDGMNRVGREGRGESVWLGFFLYDILHSFIPLCEARGEARRAEQYREYHRNLARALEEAGWDGEWYRRAYYDNGEPIGSARSDECRIDTIAQAWAVLSGAASRERAEMALDAMERHLVSEDDGIIRLLTPAFDRTPHDPGYIKGYVPGVRENGGQYTHGALWGVRALAEAGRHDRAARLLDMLSPASHARTQDAVHVYKTEPYVIAADVYGVEPHIGRGGWTWYTGSAGWMFRVALESVLGLTVHRGTELRLRPCIPADWPGFRIRYRLPDHATTYDISVENGAVRSEATMDDAALTVRDRAVVIPVHLDGRTHRVHVRLGSDVGPRYEPRPA